MEGRQEKLLLPVLGKPVLYYSLMAFNDHPEIDEIIIVANKANKREIEDLVKSYIFTKVKKIVLGGESRQLSVENGLKTLKAKDKDIVLVHNGANPLVGEEEITQVIQKASEAGAAIVGHSVKETIKEVNNEHIIKTHDRSKLFAAQTPQAADYKTMVNAVKNAQKKNLEATDEAMLFEALGKKVAYVEAGEHNFKVTTQGDYIRLKAVLGELPEDVRIGIGQDSHMFEEKVKGLVLAGVEFKEEPKLEANSDGDVILHAIFNAISQALGEMSLGFYADAECEKGVKDSKKYLDIILKKMKKEKFKINSLGIMIEAAKPKIDPMVPQLRKSLAQILDLNHRRIGITATSGEKCTAFGNGLGMQCLAIISLTK